MDMMHQLQKDGSSVSSVQVAHSYFRNGDLDPQIFDENGRSTTFLRAVVKPIGRGNWQADLENITLPGIHHEWRHLPQSAWAATPDATQTSIGTFRSHREARLAAYRVIRRTIIDIETGDTLDLRIQRYDEEQRERIFEDYYPLVRHKAMNNPLNSDEDMVVIANECGFFLLAPCSDYINKTYEDGLRYANARCNDVRTSYYYAHLEDFDEISLPDYADGRPRPSERIICAKLDLANGNIVRHARLEKISLADALRNALMCNYIFIGDPVSHAILKSQIRLDWKLPRETGDRLKNFEVALDDIDRSFRREQDRFGLDPRKEIAQVHKIRKLINEAKPGNHGTAAEEAFDILASASSVSCDLSFDSKTSKFVETAIAEFAFRAVRFEQTYVGGRRGWRKHSNFRRAHDVQSAA